MKKLILSICIAAAGVFTACDIERLPYTSQAAEEVTAASLDGLLRGSYAQLKNWADPMHRCGEYAGDNMVIRGSSTDAFYEFISYSRTPNNYRLQDFWDYSYKAIAQVSNALKMVEEGQSVEVDNQLGECYFIRGMLYFYLCRAYGRPYYQSPSTNLGVPIVNGTPDNVLDMQLPDRSTVEQTYAQAIGDLKKAAQLMTINNGPAFASKEAAWALLSRIYLYMSGTWDSPNTQYAQLCVTYSDSVIQSGKYSLLSRSDFMKYNTFKPENNNESIFVVKRMASEFSGYDHYYGVGGMYGYIGGMGWGEMYASQKYIDLLDETGRNDWYNKNIVDARAAFIEPQYRAQEGDTMTFRFIKNVYDTAGVQTGYLYVQDSVYVTSPTTAQCWGWVAERKGGTAVKKVYNLTQVDAARNSWSINYRNYFNNSRGEFIDEMCTGVVDGYINLNRANPEFYIVKCSREGEDSHLHSPLISRLAEIHLNRAEAYGKLGDYGMAVVDLDLIRTRSLPGEGYGTLTAANAEALIDKERTLELAFQAERSYDVYRNGRALTRAFPGPHNMLEVVQPTDYRVVYFIPQNAINSYAGILTQNPTSN